jgi:membrane protein CcdC involved in cytochrome C biogenesis
MAMIILFFRMRAAKKPTNAKKILLPPLFMSTGFFMFAIPLFHVDISYALIAFLFGNLLSYPLIKTSTFIEKNGDIYLERSKLFIIIIVVLVIFRLVLKSYVNEYVSLYETSSLFFILAFGMILPWRIAMYRSFQQLNITMIKKELSPK